MKLHIRGKYNLKPESLPHGEHKKGAVAFKEIDDTKKLGIVANVVCFLIVVVLAIPATIRCRPYLNATHMQLSWGCIASLLVALPHEFLHAICFREDVYLYTNLKQGMLFVVGPETMSKERFIIMSLFPNVVFGFIPYVIGLMFPRLPFFAALGTLAIGMGAGDYYNVFNALTQMPKGSRTYLYGFHSYWYMPEEDEKDKD